MLINSPFQFVLGRVYLTVIPLYYSGTQIDTTKSTEKESKNDREKEHKIKLKAFAYGFFVLLVEYTNEFIE